MAKNGFRSRLPIVVLLSGLIDGTVTLLEPLKSAVVNWGEIAIGVAALVTRLGTPFAIAFLAVAVLAMLLTAIAPRRGVPVLAALYVVLWAQGNLFVWDYGPFDGSLIDWGEHFAKGVFEAVFWTVIFALAVARPDWLRRRARSIMATVFALQLTALGSLVYLNAPFPDKPELERSNPIDEVSLYSRDLNVIIILLDGLQSDFFSEAMGNPELRAAMPPGFTYYRNAVSLYAMTEFSLQSILTSKAVPDNINSFEWMLEEMLRSLPTRLAKRAFDAWVVGFSSHTARYCDVARYKFKCVMSTTLAEGDAVGAVWRQDVSNLFAVGMFRLVPHFLKPRIYDDGAWRIRRLYPQREAIKIDTRTEPQTAADLAVFDRLIHSASAREIAPRFRLLHFYGSHYPSTVDEGCEYETDRLLTGRQMAIATTHCMLSRLYEFFHKLYEIGVYDQSLIFVVADHGHIVVPLDVSAASPALGRSTRADHRGAQTEDAPPDLHGRGVPLFLAKPLGDRRPLRISDLPVSLCDVPKSVMDAVDIENDFGCESIFAERSPRQTPRMHYRYLSDAERRKRPPSERATLVFDKYEVAGHSWLEESWIRFGSAAE